MSREEEARAQATCSGCLARTYRGEGCVCEDGGDAVDYDHALALMPAEEAEPLPAPEPQALARADLETVARLLSRELGALEAAAEHARRVDPRDAYDAENEADELRPVLERVRALLAGDEA